ncbi:MAG: AMIN domain-containing protein [Candidatus Gastranaerophilales bacterium]|nr:AMIN domain-containing protein [Candidatus Gastranaerophilales bacterium]
MEISRAKIKTISLCATSIVFLAVSSACAYEKAILSGVEINPSENGSYAIVLNTDKNVAYEKKITSKNNIVIDLKDTIVSKNSNTVYNNAKGIEHVMLKSADKGRLQIAIQGKNVSGSEVTLGETALNTVQEEKNYANTVFVNKPLNEYAPVYEEEAEDAAATATLAGMLNRLKNSNFIRSLITPSNFGWMMSFAIMFALLIASQLKTKTAKPVSIKIADENEKEEEIIRANLERRRGLIGSDMGTKQILPKTNVSSLNYGLRAYGNKNPFPETDARVSGLQRKNIRTQYDRSLVQRPSNLTRKSAGLRTNSITQRALQEDIQKNTVHIDNVKFLESMAKIYEKSGRVDLANGLANNIKRARVVGK